ncbi:MAG: baseplate J/gp47 family protein [Anaerovibrio sp.]|nr:baseplate J/gp47 family protein [Selenomonadaceae bacterium]MDY6053819.1 baseplate J/gp47 family protein [Anaerovibrio sp.]
MALDTLPKITFAEMDSNIVDIEVVDTVEKFLGRKLGRADPVRLFLRGVEALLIQQRILIDEAAKMNLLAYSKGDYLDHLGALVGVERIPAAAAKTTMQLALSAARDTTTIIPKGTRFTAGDNIMFALDNTMVINSGEIEMQASATCTAKGELGNGYAIGEINKIADPIPFLASVSNTTVSDGGADIESDTSYRERIHIAPESFAVAGPAGAYEAIAKGASALISDVRAVNFAEEPGVVRLYVLLKNGKLPDEEMLKLVENACSARDVRPLTDKVMVLPPEKVEYDLNVSYWIDRDNAVSASNIQLAAEQAVKDYVSWQGAKIGRDINPTELIGRLREVGVKRVDVGDFAAKVIQPQQVAFAKSCNVRFEGLEDE